MSHLFPLGFLSPFPNFALPWLLLNSLGFLGPIALFLILGVHGLAINPLLSLFSLLWKCHGPFSLFHLIYCPWFAFSLFSGSFKPIYLFKTHLFISWACDPLFLPLGLNGFFIRLPTPFCLCCWASSSHLGFQNGPQQEVLHLLRVWGFLHQKKCSKNLSVRISIEKLETEICKYEEGTQINVFASILFNSWVSLVYMPKYNSRLSSMALFQVNSALRLIFHGVCENQSHPLKWHCLEWCCKELSSSQWPG